MNRYKPALAISSIAVTAITLSAFAQLLSIYIGIKYNWLFELVMVLGQVLFQLMFVHRFSFIKKKEYFIDLFLISFLGSVLLWPMLILDHFFIIESRFILAWFFMVVGILFMVHRKVVKQLELPSFLSYTWILYRFLILIFILK